MAYDTSTANPVNPQGSAGGGNVFNVGPLFGSWFGSGGGSSGDNGATTTSKDTAALGGSTSAPGDVGAQPATTTTAKVASALADNAGILLLGGFALVVLAFGVLHFRHSK